MLMPHNFAGNFAGAYISLFKDLSVQTLTGSSPLPTTHLQLPQAPWYFCLTVRLIFFSLSLSLSLLHMQVLLASLKSNLGLF